MGLAALTSCAVAATYTAQGSVSSNALGLSHAVLQVLASQLVERAGRFGGRDESSSGLLSQDNDGEHWISVLRDVAAAATASTAIAAASLESSHFGGLQYYGLLGQAMGDNWIFGQGILLVLFALGTVLVHMAMFGSHLLMVSSMVICYCHPPCLISISTLQGSVQKPLMIGWLIVHLQIHQQSTFPTALAVLAAAVCSQLLLDFSLARLWFAGLCSSAVYFSLDDQQAASKIRMKARFGRLTTLAAALSLGGLALYHFQKPTHTSSLTSVAPEVRLAEGENVAPPIAPLDPLQYTNTHIHPIKSLMEDAQAAWEQKLRSQSQTLEAAVAEYRRRYGIPPPPYFDKWYEFAKRKGVQLIDEYDTIYHSLLPFWALSPKTIRARAREALGFGDNNLMGLLIREGKVAHVEGGPEWLQQAAVGMMEEFIDYLPDMDLAFNIHDEPRVVVPHDELSRMVDIALNKNLPAAAAYQSLNNAFSGRPDDVSMHGKRIAEFKTTRFNAYAHQPTWIPSRMSCSPDSPARALEESLEQDNLTAYALGELGFIYNHTAFTDVCNSPSFGHSHGFFERPNSFNVVHDLFPIFSQSKMSSFQDIVYPSPWYWYGKVQYKETADMDWKDKLNRLWWRGSTTGGFSRNGGWKRQHRQQFVRTVNALDEAKILTSSNSANTDNAQPSNWITKSVPRQDFKEVVDVHFSGVGQCDPGDCDAQREFFEVVEPAEQQDAWKYKYLLDIDGNAFSGRFYAFLKSRSLPFKMAVFREWHEEWIVPWVHYVPVSLRGGEALEAVRYFDVEEEGKELGRRIVERGREAGLRNEDFEVWFFRLLLEYGRVVDERREGVGFQI